jgi:hypothetical protein
LASKAITFARHRREQAGALFVVFGAGDAEQVDMGQRVRAPGGEDVAPLAACDDGRGEAGRSPSVAAMVPSASARRARRSTAVDDELPGTPGSAPNVDLAHRLAAAKARAAHALPLSASRRALATAMPRRRAARQRRRRRASTSASAASSQASSGGGPRAANSRSCSRSISAVSRSAFANDGVATSRPRNSTLLATPTIR